MAIVVINPFIRGRVWRRVQGKHYRAAATWEACFFIPMHVQKPHTLHFVLKSCQHPTPLVTIFGRAEPRTSEWLPLLYPRQRRLLLHPNMNSTLFLCELA